MNSSGPSLLTYLLAGTVLFGFGYARAVWVRARADYNDNRAKTKSLRKSKWSAFARAVKLGVIVAVIGLVLAAWFLRDARETINDTPVGDTSTAPR